MTCAADHAIWQPGSLRYVEELDVLASHASDACLRCRLCGRCFWVVCDVGGKWDYVQQWEIDPGLAQKAAVEHDPAALAQLFVSRDLPHGPVWELTLGLVEIFRALTPGSTDADRARALREAGAGARWAEAIRVLESTARGALRGLPELSFPVNVRLTGHAVREWHEVGNALVFLTEQSEMLRLEARGVTRLELAAPPRYLAASGERLLLAIGDAAFVVVDAAGLVSSWPSKGPFTAAALDDGWWLHVPDTGDTERVIEMRKPDGHPCVGFRRAFDKGARWMPPPRRMGGGWVLSNLVDVDDQTQALSLVDRSWKLAAQSGPAPLADRRVVVQDAKHLLAQTDDAVELWRRDGASLALVETIPCRSSWWIGDRLVTDGRDGVVTARDRDGRVLWQWSRETSGAAYGVASRDRLLLYDDDHAHWLGLDGTVRRSFDVESAHVRVGREGTVYLASLVDLWILAYDEAHALVIDDDLEIETVCGDDVLLRGRDGRCVLVDRDRRAGRFVAKDAHLPVTGTRGGPWLVEGERVRGVFAMNAHAVAESIAMTAGATTRVLPGTGSGDAAAVVLPDGRAPALVMSWSPGYGRIVLAGGGAWNFTRHESLAEVLSKVAAAIDGWQTSISARTVPTLCEIALAALDVVNETFEERWTVSIPGTPEPSELWLHPPDRPGGAVGVFAGRVNVASVDYVPFPTRGDLALHRDALVAAVKQQRARYERNLAQEASVLTLAEALATRLSSRLGRTCEVVCWGATSYEGTVAPFLRAKDDPRRTLVWLRPGVDRIEVHGGAWGRAGWSTTGTDVDAMIEPLAEAIERGADLFCVGRLKRGARYRVTRDFEGLKQGEIVTVEGLNDIDNHHGELVFTRQDGREIAIGGDFSSPEQGWVGELYLVFEKE